MCTNISYFTDLEEQQHRRTHILFRNTRNKLRYVTNYLFISSDSDATYLLSYTYTLDYY